jgi:signal transduction histidine kinase
LNKEKISLQPILEETLRQANQLDVDRRITLDIPTDTAIIGDRDMLKQVMIILLDNALKHSHGDIHVVVKPDNEQMGIRVEDEGPGISQDKLAHIFDRFYRDGENSITPGFGLGLPIAKGLTEGMAGQITIESNPDKGSVIILRFPAAEFD